MKSLVWFKKDLRLHDQLALYHACKQGTDGVIGLYIIDPAMWRQHHVAHCHIEFILRGLQTLRADLEEIGIPLIVYNTLDMAQDDASLILEFMQKHKLDALFYNREYEVNEKKRDDQVTQLLTKNNIRVHAFDDQLIIPANQTLKSDNTYFKVFTPFKRHWQQVFRHQASTSLLPKPKINAPIKLASSEIPKILPNVQSRIPSHLWPAGEAAAKERLTTFLRDKIGRYDTERDFPALDNTSKLSPYLALGMISPRECFFSALQYNDNELDTGNRGALTWMSELIWREFYRSILIYVPRVCKNQAYQQKTENLPWSYDENLLQQWQQGMTGFPIVDAAMRQLNSTGWMHNRLRMIVAMFLSKNLFLDWRLGEKYFAENLIDFDFASNNGGWQWSASTGTDAVPYFRIFNPITQSQRFDPEGEFIRQYCPELKAFSIKEIHDPYNKNAKLALASQYPKPIIDYAQSRAKTLLAFKNL